MLTLCCLRQSDAAALDTHHILHSEMNSEYAIDEFTQSADLGEIRLNYYLPKNFARAEIKNKHRLSCSKI